MVWAGGLGAGLSWLHQPLRPPGCEMKSYADPSSPAILSQYSSPPPHPRQPTLSLEHAATPGSWGSCSMPGTMLGAGDMQVTRKAYPWPQEADVFPL